MDRDKLYQRFPQDECHVQAGNLASTLARLSSCAEDARYDQIVADLLHEGDLLMEWCGPNAPIDIAIDLASMLRELVRWRRMRPSDAACSLLAFRARQTRDRLLEAGEVY